MIHLMEAGMGMGMLQAWVTSAQQRLHHSLLYPNLVVLEMELLGVIRFR